MRIAIASDHAATDLKAALRDWLMEEGHEVADLGPDEGESVDYPDYGFKLASVVADGTAERGIALCGSGIGISIAVNRNPDVRCALVSEPLSAALSREHNDANCLAMGARLTGIEMAKSCIATFLATDFADADDFKGRRRRRVRGRRPLLAVERVKDRCRRPPLSSQQGFSYRLASSNISGIPSSVVRSRSVCRNSGFAGTIPH